MGKDKDKNKECRVYGNKKCKAKQNQNVEQVVKVEVNVPQGGAMGATGASRATVTAGSTLRIKFKNADMIVSTPVGSVGNQQPSLSASLIIFKLS
jgi:ribosomal protein S9